MTPDLIQITVTLQLPVDDVARIAHLVTAIKRHTGWDCRPSYIIEGAIHWFVKDLPPVLVGRSE